MSQTPYNQRKDYFRRYYRRNKKAQLLRNRRARLRKANPSTPEAEIAAIVQEEAEEEAKWLTHILQRRPFD